MKAYLYKTISGLIPADPESEVWYKKIKQGVAVSVEAKTIRNYNFHKKLFSLLNLAYEYWEPGEIDSKYGTPEKNFDRFRKDLIIMAGYYHIVIRLDESVRIEADSISFAKMDQETFDKLYNNILTVILEKISVLNEMTADEVNELVNKFLTFV